MPSHSPPRLAMNCCRAVRPECQGQQHTSGGVRCRVPPQNSAPAQALLAHCPALPASSLHITPRVLVTESVANKPTAPAPARAHVKCRALCDPELPTDCSHSPESESAASTGKSEGHFWKPQQDRFQALLSKGHYQLSWRRRHLLLPSPPPSSLMFPVSGGRQWHSISV